MPSWVDKHPNRKSFYQQGPLFWMSEVTRYLLTSWWWSIFWLDALTSAELLWTVSMSLLAVTMTASIKQQSPRDHRQEAEKLFWCPTTPQTVSHDGKQCRQHRPTLIIHGLQTIWYLLMSIWLCELCQHVSLGLDMCYQHEGFHFPTALKRVWIINVSKQQRDVISSELEMQNS